MKKYRLAFGMRPVVKPEEQYCREPRTTTVFFNSKFFYF